MTMVIQVELSTTNYQHTTAQISEWAKARESRYICAANVHMLMEAHDSKEFAAIVNQADMVTPDGMPLVWMMRLKGHRDQQRVYGPTLMLHVLDMASRENIPVGFYGDTPEVLDKLTDKMISRNKTLKISFSLSPPFRDMTPDEDREIIEKINASGAKILFVGLGCPKQEIWMANHRGKVKAVMIGVGAAFDFHAGVKPQAPLWMQRMGLEWSFRLFTEPRRLWKRYLYHNPRFVGLAIADLLGLYKK